MDACKDMKPKEDYYDAFVRGNTLVELPKLKTREERIKNGGSLPPSIPDDEMSKLIELMNKERIELGLNPVHIKRGSK